MKYLFTIIVLASSILGFSQTASISGQLQNDNGEAVMFANVALMDTSGNKLVKVEISNENGIFSLKSLNPGNYYLQVSYVGLGDLKKEGITLKADEKLDLGILSFGAAAIELTEAVVKADRVMVEVKSDRTVFNVDGTINSTGSDAIELMRKAPGVTVDNNDNISVLGRAGVLLYVDGKRLPLSGDDLTNYLRTLPADQIDKIDIITNPGARYEAEGNAGIIDIRLKKDKSIGANGSVRGTYSQGIYANENLNFTGNYRNKTMNVFATAGLGDITRFHNMNFQSYQRDLFLNERNDTKTVNQNYNYRLGTDFFINKKNTIGFLINGGQGTDQSFGYNEIAIAVQEQDVDSILVSDSEGNADNSRNAFNINYRFDDRKKGQSLNVDLDYGTYSNDNKRYIPNLYFNPTKTAVVSEINNQVNTETTIDIYTGKIDYEANLLGGKIGIGGKYSQVVSDNTFLFFDEEDAMLIQNDTFSNAFLYNESVYAGYVNFNRKITDKVSFSAGLRAEQTNATGDLRVFIPALAEAPVDLDYLQFFPSAGLSWQIKPMHSLNFNYGRRVNRPDYNVLNPFNNRLSELSYSKGNPRLNPEIVNNFEVGYTMNYRYNFKLAYSKTSDQITRLIAPDPIDPRSGFITWANLAEQTVISGNISAPMQFAKFWNAYFNISCSYIDNQADYGNGAVVDVQVFSYTFFTQQTFDLPWKLKGEISGYYSGPGVWGGVFEYESSWSLNLGLQRKFLDDKLNVRVSANDLFYETGWDGVSEFNGLQSVGNGRWDSRRIAVSLGYNFGNQNIKSRKRKTGLEEEAGRVGN